jgi:hypothetical protein
MKKLFLSLFALILISSLSIFSQTLQERAQSLKRPGDCGVPDYDAFKNSSFTLKDDILKTDKNYSQVTNNVARYKSGERAVTVDSVKSDINKVKSMKTSLKTFDDKLVSLTEKGKELMNNVTKVKPVTKIKPATSNTKDSVKAVDISKELLKTLSGKVDADLTTLNGLLTKAGGKE